MKILVTGAAGFIGFFTALRLLERGDEVIGIDNLNDYYDPRLKESRLEILRAHEGFTFTHLNIADRAGMEAYFCQQRPQRVIHLAAQAGVRYSLENPHAYVDANLVGFINILEGCRHIEVEHLVYASSSSVYGGNTKVPFSTDDNVDHPLSLYAATKKANELMAHTYSHLYNLATTGLRFFTVYGPWGRPDMAPIRFAGAICAGKPLEVYNYGEMQRDFTYIDDIVDGVVWVNDHLPIPVEKQDDLSPADSFAPYKVYNIGNHQPVELMDFIRTLEKCIGKSAQLNLLPMQPGDVPKTFADIDSLMTDSGLKPNTSLEEGIGKFVAWYKDYYQK